MHIQYQYDNTNNNHKKNSQRNLFITLTYFDIWEIIEASNCACVFVYGCSQIEINNF